MRGMANLIEFDEQRGLLTCAAGVTLNDILCVFVPMGWFIPVSPGTKFVTVGGAIASDVHGKNHHVDGTFTRHVERIKILLGNGEVVVTSPTERSELFHATCGGMGLTGVILAATVRLQPIRSSEIVETTVKAKNIEALLELFSVKKDCKYSVAWIDCVARGGSLGRSLLMVGEHAEDGHLQMGEGAMLRVPCDFPTGLLNRGTARVFNSMIYWKSGLRRRTRRVPLDRFFYPLDRIADWNRIYGRAGFLQYQCVVPSSSEAAGLRDILGRIAASGLGSFLAVLKVFGKANENYLSFPIEGYTLAVDFKAEPAALRLLDELDHVVLSYGGRLYLTKDARMSKATFRAGYPRWQAFEEVRAKWHAAGKFASVQSKRLGLA